MSLGIQMPRCYLPLQRRRSYHHSPVLLDAIDKQKHHRRSSLVSQHQSRKWPREEMVEEWNRRPEPDYAESEPSAGGIAAVETSTYRHTFELSIERADPYKMKQMADLRWATIQLATMSGAAGDPDFLIQSDDEDEKTLACLSLLALPRLFPPPQGHRDRHRDRHRHRYRGGRPRRCRRRRQSCPPRRSGRHLRPRR